MPFTTISSSLFLEFLRIERFVPNLSEPEYRFITYPLFLRVFAKLCLTTPVPPSIYTLPPDFKYCFILESAVFSVLEFTKRMGALRVVLTIVFILVSVLIIIILELRNLLKKLEKMNKKKKVLNLLLI